MKLRRPLLATAVPVAAGLLCAGPALAAAAPKVSFRVEGASRTLLAPTTVSVPSSGSITKGGTPAGECPADSAAGALDAATHGRWNGTYSSGLGIEVTNILGTNALYAHGSYWEFFVGDHAASEGVCDTKLTAGEQLLFAQVPAKGKAELPLVVSGPATARAGRRFDVRTFVYSGKGSHPTPVTHPTLTVDAVGAHGSSHRLKVSTTSGAAGVESLRLSHGTYTVAASAAGEIRSAPVTVSVK